MCGIVGVVGERIERAALTRMRDTLAHRGPDDADTWTSGDVGLAHRRLAVISPVAAGRQPMANAAGDLRIVYNGEIYNYRALRTELEAAGYAFTTETDTEVVLAAYATWGVAAVSRLDGMFAFGIWDAPRRRLVLARDRIGIKPLYYWEHGERIVFASEPKAILAHPDASARVDPHALLDYLTYGYVPHDRCIFAGLRKLPAACTLVWTRGTAQRETYWELSPSRRIVSLQEAADAVARCAEKAVAAQLVSDVPLGAFLSGGIDSSAVTAYAARASDTPLSTFSVGFNRSDDELPFARRVADRYATNHTEQRVEIDRAETLLDRLAEHYDEPLADTSTLPTFLLSEVARGGVTVALSGDGGDELFSGYPWYDAQRNPAPAWGPLALRLIGHARGVRGLARSAMFNRRLEPDPLVRHLRHLELFDRWEVERLAGPSLSAPLRDHDERWLLEQHDKPHWPRAAALRHLDLKTFLADDILVKVDRASMAHGLEVRPPLLAHELVELAFDLAPEVHVADGRGKAVLRRAVRPLLPHAIIDRPKRGFSAPVTAWFRSRLWQRWRPEIERSRLVRDGWIDPRWIGWMVDNFTERRWAKTWSLMVLARWYARWVEA